MAVIILSTISHLTTSGYNSKLTDVAKIYGKNDSKDVFKAISKHDAVSKYPMYMSEFECAV